MRDFTREANSIRLKKSFHTLIETEPPIIRMEMGSHEFLEVEDIHALRHANLELSEGKPFCVLLDTSKGYSNVSPEATKLLTSKEFADKRMGAAFITRSLASRLVGNFFIRLGGRHHKTRLFENEEDALGWLKTFASWNPSRK